MMKALSLLLLLALSAAPLMGQSAKEIADQLHLPALAPGAKELPMPEVPRGVKIELGGADFEQIIDTSGKITPVLSDTPVLVYFKVTKGAQTAESKDYEVVVKPAAPPAAGANPKPATVPAILQWKGAQGEWKPGSEVCVYSENNEAIADAKAFCKELRRLLPNSKVKLVKDPKLANIHLSILPDPHPKNSEAYTMKISPENVQIEGATPAAVFMGTRTLLQILSHSGAIPCGQAKDFPRYPVRGCMLDIARSPFSLQDLRDVVNLMA